MQCLIRKEDVLLHPISKQHTDMFLTLHPIFISLLTIVLGLLAAVGVAAFFVACWRIVKRKNK